MSKVTLKNRKLPTIVKWINNNLGHLGYNATIKESLESTDRKSNLRCVAGKGKEGHMVTITHNDLVVVKHNSAETYSYNEQLETEVRAICKKHNMRKEYFESRAKPTAAKA